LENINNIELFGFNTRKEKTMKKSERGQIIVILAVVLVAVLGVTALAVDGSMIYSERRDDQTTADSSALSAAQTASASATCATARTTAITQAQQYASQYEGVVLANDTTSPNRVEATCNADNSKLTVKIVVTSNTPTTFAKMVSRKQLQTTVESTSQVTFGGGTYAGGNGLVSTSTTCDTSSSTNGANGGIHALGNGQINIIGGGAFSNTCLRATGSSMILAYGSNIQYETDLLIDKSANVLILGDSDPVNAPNINTSGVPQITWNGSHNTANPDSLWPVKVTQALSLPDIPTMTPLSPPTCGSAKSASPAGAGDTIYPGTYTSLTWSSWGSGNLTFTPGVYCFSGAVNLGGGGGTASVIMDGVTLYFTGSSANNFSTSGNLRYSFNNGIFYSTNGNFTTGHTFSANNSKFYLGSGNFTVDGSAVLSMNNSSIYLNNGNFKATAGGKIDASHITIYIKQGNFTIEGGAIVNMTAPNCPDTSCGVGPAIQGLLLYMDKTNTGSLNVNNGTSTAHVLSGTMYAPNAPATFDGGTSTTATNVQLIAKGITVIAGAKLNMNLADVPLYMGGGSPSVELLK
jgi:hypothetical protein